MVRHLTYIFWLVLFLALPIVVLITAAPRALRRQWRAIGLTLAIALLGGWVWDKLAINLGAWRFDPDNIIGRWIGGLPIEEWCWIAGTTILFGGITVVCAERFEAARIKQAEAAASAPPAEAPGSSVA